MTEGRRERCRQRRRGVQTHLVMPRCSGSPEVFRLAFDDAADVFRLAFDDADVFRLT
jgi:hypothetical protein